jgi:hypothetical protein
MATKTNNILRVSIFFLALICLITSVYIYKSQESFEKFKEKSKVENQLKQNHLDEILNKYDSLSAISKLQNVGVVSSSVLKEHKSTNKFYQNLGLQSIDKQTAILKSIIKKDKEQIVFLEKKIILEESTLGKLESLKQPHINTKNNKLSISNITSRGVKIVSDKSPINKKIQEIRICFTLEGNELIKKAEKQFFIQIVNPNKEIISSQATFIELKDVKLIYSAKVSASYNQKDIDICTYVDLEKNKTIKGKYQINIYNDFSKIGTSVFEYN